MDKETIAQVLYSNSANKKQERKLLQKLNPPHLCDKKEINTRFQEVAIFMLQHIKHVGEQQAIKKDLQRGISILNNNRRNSLVKAKNILLEDGIYGAKTYFSMCDICKNYTAQVIKEFIKKGIRNNIIFDTKNNTRTDTQELLSDVLGNLKEA